MPLFLKRARGTAVRVDLGVRGANYAKVFIKGTKIGRSSSAGFVITQAAVSEQENVQFQPSTSDRIYAYAFGRGLGSLTLGGMAFPQFCQNGAQPLTPGVKMLFDEYEKSRFSKRFKPLQINFSNMTFNGYLIKCGANYSDSAHSIANWSMEFVTYRSDNAKGDADA